MHNSLVSITNAGHAKSAGDAWSVTLPTPATAGHTLCVGALGGAIIVPSSPSGWARGPAYGGGTFDLSLFHLAATGGETTISGTGAGDNIEIYAFEMPAGYTYLTGTNNGSGITLDESTDFLVSAGPSTVTGDCIVVGLFAVIQGSTFSAANAFTAMGPAGQLIVSAAEQDASGTPVIAAVGIADVDTSHHYPGLAANGSYAATSQYIGAGPGRAFAAQAVFARTGSPVVTFANPIERSESEPGHRVNNWYNIPSSGLIAGFPTAPSVLQGDTMTFKVDSLGDSFTTDIVELGHFGRDSNGAKLVATLTGTTVSQPAPTVDSTLGVTTFAAWTANCSWTVPIDQPSGEYYAIFKTSAGHESATHFVVREAAVTGKVVLVTSTLTKQAYSVTGATTNSGTLGSGTWTGRSLYQAGSDGASSVLAHRGFGLPYDRPYSTEDTHGQTGIFDSEYGFRQLLRAQCYDITELTDIDVHADPTILADAALVIVLGHHEYLTDSMWDGYQGAMDAGVNMVFYGSNFGGWRVRFAVADTAFRMGICYKEGAGAGFDGSTADPTQRTGTFRDADTPNNAFRRLENALTGAQFVASGPVTTPLVFPASALPHVRHSPTLAAGMTDTANSGGYEIESANGVAGQPSDLVVLWSTSIAVTTGANAAGTVYTTSETVTATGSLYRRSSGALIFSAGTWRAFWSASRFRGASPAATVVADIQHMALALLFDMGAVPARVTSLRPGEDTDLTDPATGAPTGGRNAVALAYGLTVPTASGNAGFFALMSP